MIIAQTVLPSATENSQPIANPAANGWWWLLPLVIGFVWAVWYLRQIRNRLEQKSSSKPHKQIRASSNKANVSSLREDSTVADNTISRNISSNKAGKKKKKDQRKSQRSAKPLVSSEPISSEEKKSRVAGRTTTTETPSLDRPDAVKPVPVPVPAPAPVNAIFEPLFEVVQHRRKTQPTPSTLPLQTNQTVVSTQPSGGKFERNSVTAAATRSIASRWPTPTTQQRKTAEVETTRPQLLPQTDPISVPTTIPSLTTLPSQEVVSSPSVAPAKGLKSFVTKVRSTSATNSDPITVDQSISP